MYKLKTVKSIADIFFIQVVINISVLGRIFVIIYLLGIEHIDILVAPVLGVA